MPNRRIVGLLTFVRGIGRELIEGVRDYAAAHPDWHVVPATYIPAAQQMLAEWPLDGLLFDGDRPWLQAIGSLSVPMVNLNYNPSSTGAPSVAIDDHHTVRMAVEHFLERRFEHFAFVGYSDANYSLVREKLFRDQLRRRGLKVRVFRRSFVRLANWAGPALGEWLADLPRPLAVFMCHDALAQRVIEGCRQVGLAIPQDVAVLGVDNQMVECELLRPTVSSIMYPSHEIGWGCAELLDRLMAGKPVPSKPGRIPPPGIAARTSTDIYHYGDPLVAEALQFIRQHAERPLSVEQVLEHVPASRSMLERRFRRVLGTTPLREIQRAHVDIACHQLRTTRLPLSVIAHNSGFRHASHLSQVFKEVMHITPSAYRHRDPADDATDQTD